MFVIDVQADIFNIQHIRNINSRIRQRILLLLLLLFFLFNNGWPFSELQLIFKGPF